jgi:hypothetical protein
MNKITMLAVAVAVVGASPVFAKESANIKVSRTKHHAAVAGHQASLTQCSIL